MKRFLAILIFIAFLAQTFQQSVIILDYRLNTNSYAKNCENIDLPELKCKGKCQMMKKIQEEEKKKERLPDLKPVNKAEVLFYTESIIDISESYPLNDRKVYPPYISRYGLNEPADIFHPPAIV